jgi:hypothetical protein
VDPVTIAALASVAVAAMKSGSGSGAPPAPTITQANPVVNSWMDSSGWTVATSGSVAHGGARSQEAPAFGGDITLLLLGGALLAVALIWAHKAK